MWLVTSVNKEQRAAIFEYFKNPSMEPGQSVKAARGVNGAGGASTAVINMRGGMDAPKTALKKETGSAAGSLPRPVDIDEAKRLAAEAERKQLLSLLQDLRAAIDKSKTLRPFKDQLLLDITPEGLRIQIVDAQNRPMFDLGSSRLKDYTVSILHELTAYLNSVPNRISLSGHTDTTPYMAKNGYTNWDLSADRANSARRALEGGGLGADKVARVVGLSSVVLFDAKNPRNPINRRISIIVMTKQAEESALHTDTQDALADPAAAPAAGSVSGEAAVKPAASAGAAPKALTATPAAPALPPAAHST
jgi:chemotaxis protein MotB